MPEDGFSKQRLRVNNAPDVHFEGKLLHEYTTQDRDGSKDRWTELRLWETRGGAWIAEQLGCSTRRGEGDLRDVLVIQRFGSSVMMDIQLDDDDEPEPRELRTIVRDEPEAIGDVMAFFGWTVVAKAFAKAAGWNVVRHVA